MKRTKENPARLELRAWTIRLNFLPCDKRNPARFGILPGGNQCRKQ
jgi:hypothetical protein